VTPPSRPFRWVRMRGVGGRTLGWSRVLLRLSDREFKAGGQDGASRDWPISYADLAPYYDEVEAFLGVHGNSDHLENVPDGVYRPAIDLTPAELHLKRTIEKKWPGRRLVSTRGVLDDESGRGGSSASTTLPAALATGRTQLVTDAFVRCVTVDPVSGRAGGVTVVDRHRRRETAVKARLVALCASTIETTRILLNSRGPGHPHGLGSSSGLLGLGLMDHTATFTRGLLPVPRSIPRRLPSGGPHGFMIPRFRNLSRRDGAGFVRGYGIQGTAQRAFFGEPLAPLGWASFRMTALGETLPRRENRVTLDPTVRDAFGIPVARIDYSWTENEKRMVEDARRAMHEMVRAAGGVVLSETKSLSVPGQAVHEVGTAPMGADPRSSVVDRFNRCWDSPNVLVLDGAAWPTCGWQNPTLTMMALAVRACHHAVRALRAGH
jgi:choline dehydrogenase-like flavoprotein